MLRTLWAVLWGLTLLYVADLGSVGSFSSPQQQQTEQSSGNTYEKYCATLCRAVLERSDRAAHWTGEAIHEYREEIIAVGTVVLAFATGFLWKSTKALVVGADNTAKRQLRAYVMVEKVVITGTGEVENFAAGITVRCYGNTPAYEMTVQSELQLREHPLVGDLPAIGDSWSGAVPMAPGSHSGFTKMINFTEVAARVDELRAGTACIYVYGEIRYRDAFGAPHWTKFRFQRDETPQSRVVDVFSTSAEGNSTDDEFRD